MLCNHSKHPNYVRAVYTNAMKLKQNEPLAPITSFNVGGPAERLITVEDSSEVEQATKDIDPTAALWFLGYGTNVLISDYGLPGTTILFRNKEIREEDGLLVADAGVWWDDLVLHAIERNLWGLELMSGIPGSVGAGVFINITAYGQAQADTLEWIDVIDVKRHASQRLIAKDLKWDYKQSIFQENDDYAIVRAAYRLSPRPTKELTYQRALDVANELNIAPDTLDSRRKIILEARKQAGSLFDYEHEYAKSVGSFFRNPVATSGQAEAVMAFDETGKTREQITAMNQEHGGAEMRVSAAHVMLAAGFKRGQSWGAVRLHPQHVLKIENTGGATAQEIYNVAQEIMSTVENKLGIKLEPEARILGRF